MIVLLCLSAKWWAGAAEVPGQGDARFQAALTLWLEDDDETSLPEFAALAAEGNRAARILLALIYLSPQLHRPWLAGRSPEAIVPAAIWNASPRGRASVQAHARFAWSDRAAGLVYSQDPCLAAALATKDARFSRRPAALRTSRPSAPRSSGLSRRGAAARRSSSPA